MDPKAALTNLRYACRICPGVADRIRFLRYLYADGLPRALRPEKPAAFRFRLRPPIGDLRLRLRPRSSGDLFVFGEVFEQEVYRVPLASAPATILDLGANIGLSTLFFARAYPGARIAAVEPADENATLLRQNLAANRVDAVVFEAAVSVQDGSASLVTCEHSYGHKIGGISFGKAFVGTERTVPCLSIPTLMRRLGWDRIGLVKMDIEGYEGELLRGDTAWLEKIDVLCLETHEGVTDALLEGVAATRGIEFMRLPSGLAVLGRKGSFHG